jgi:hypothetical protein
VGSCELVVSGSVFGLGAGCCEYGNKCVGSIKGVQCFNQRSDLKNLNSFLICVTLCHYPYSIFIQSS